MRNNNQVLLKFELMSAADDSQYYVHSRVEIASILRAIMQKNTLLSVYFDEGNSFIVTTILDVDDSGTITLDRGPDPRINARLPQAARLICVTSLDKVKVQFICNEAVTTEHDGCEAFLLPMPEKLLRLQRREYFRLVMPVTNPLKCRMKIKGEGEIREMELNVADISCGGLATVSSTDLPVFEPMTRFSCVLALGDTEPLSMTVELRNTFEITLANGRKQRRCGYQFIDLPEKARAQVQRYIMLQQRAQRARAASLA
jgi:c-di-GMP-binding flagellar brake protein YcgR